MCMEILAQNTIKAHFKIQNIAPFVVFFPPVLCKHTWSVFFVFEPRLFVFVTMEQPEITHAKIHLKHCTVSLYLFLQARTESHHTDRKSGILPNTLKAICVLQVWNPSFLQAVLLLGFPAPHKAFPQNTLGWGRSSTRPGCSCSRWAQPSLPAPAWKMQIRQTSSAPALEGAKPWIPAPGYGLLSNTNICIGRWQSWRETLSNQALQNLGLTISR